MHDEESVEPDAPAFFLSYARAHAPRRAPGPRIDFNDPVTKFFTDLSVLVSHALAWPVGLDVGYMDVNAEVGGDWRPELLRKVGTCTAFVALLSEPYLYRSEWCPMEWHLFAQREVRAKDRDAPGDEPTSALVPVLWTPIDRKYPPVIEAAEHFMPIDLPPEYRGLYESDGLLGARNVEEAAYKAIVWKIARQIQKICATQHVASLIRENTAGLPKTFWGEMP